MSGLVEMKYYERKLKGGGSAYLGATPEENTFKKHPIGGALVVLGLGWFLWKMILGGGILDAPGQR